MPEEPSRKCEFDPDKLILDLELEIAGDVKAITPVIKHIMEKVRQMGCAAGKEFEVETAINEALANAVVHGCRKDSERAVQIWVGCDEERGMLVVVRDPGPGFDPGKIPSPVKAERLYLEHGRGIFLINQLMDEVHFKRGGTEIWMRKN